MKWIADPQHLDSIDALDTMYPTSLTVLKDKGRHLGGGPVNTTYGVVVRGRADVTIGGSTYQLWAGDYFSGPGDVNVELFADGEAVCINRHGFRGQVCVGRLEDRGRLSYIDGCSDSMLVYPPRLGDPVLNHLHFPGDILQTQHTHPSIRMGVVMAGEGVSWRGKFGQKEDLRPFMDFAAEHGLEKVVAWYDAYKRQANLTEREQLSYRLDAGQDVLELDIKQAREVFGNIDMLYHLKAGGVFQLEEGELHSFATVPGGHMEIVAYHPDSDWGPTDQDHPMLNRTYIPIR